jgi:hypothetical protein
LRWVVLGIDEQESIEEACDQHSIEFVGRGADKLFANAIKHRSEYAEEESRRGGVFRRFVDIDERANQENAVGLRFRRVVRQHCDERVEGGVRR